MPLRIDARLPVRLAPGFDPGPDDPVGEGTMLLVEDGFDLPPRPGLPPVRLARFAPDHDGTAGAAACACCGGRAPFATELGALFNERARGTVPFFRAVLAVGSARGLAHARAALDSDPFLLGRYRVEAGLCPAPHQEPRAPGPRSGEAS